MATAAHDAVPDSLRCFKSECARCFRGPEAPGLIIPLKAVGGVFEGLCPTCLPAHLRRHFKDESLYAARLVTKKTPIPKEEGVAEPEPKRLAINLPGGLQTGGPEFLSEDTWSVVKLPSEKEQVWDELPVEVRQLVALMRDSESALKVAQAAVGGGVWDGSERPITTQSIVQIANPPPMAKSGWRCQTPGCDKRENLWLNLSDGSILCGRRFHDGTGGNGCALNHYNNSGRRYPLAVNLGTIHAGGADVFSYAENDEVIDPKLREHLAHFGLDMDTMCKVEETIEERELAANLAFRDRAVLEADAELEPAFGPGLTPIHNLGNTCYQNSVLQLLSLSPGIGAKYVAGAGAVMDAAGSSEDLSFQAAKVFSSLASGDFSPAPIPSDSSDVEKIAHASLAGIRPHLFRSLVGRGHPEFSTRRQQDAEEFLRYFLERLGADAARDFRFRVQDRLEDVASGRCRYSTKTELVLTVPLPAELIENREAVEEWKQRAAAAKAAGEKLPVEDFVRPLVSLHRCLERLAAPGFIEGYRSPVTGEAAGAKRSSGLLSFPDLLFLHLSRFGFNAEGEVEKSQASVQIRDEVDLSVLKVPAGLQPGEVELTEADGGGKAAASGGPSEELLMLLSTMGFSREQVVMASAKVPQPPQPDAVAEWLFMNPDAVPDPPKPAVNGAAETLPVTDGPPKYRLRGFLSHTGSSTASGHYIAYVRRGEEWFLMNDEAVSKSRKPPKDLAYLLLLQRI